MVAKKALGRGLKALMPEVPTARSGLIEIPISKIVNNPNQPRTIFSDQALDELASSILIHGVIQPILVTVNGEGTYVIIAGERRWRAAKKAGLQHIPAVVREHVKKENELELALVENIQRRDLTPLEEARAYDQLRTTLGLSQHEIARRVGVNRSTVANALRLLRLEPEIQSMIDAGELSGGHARTLLVFPDAGERLRWAERVLATGMSVRELESAAKDLKQPEPRKEREKPVIDPNLKVAEEKLSLRLGAQVKIQSRHRGGRILINCTTNDELMRVFDLLVEE